ATSRVSARQVGPKGVRQMRKLVVLARPKTNAVELLRRGRATPLVRPGPSPTSEATSQRRRTMFRKTTLSAVATAAAAAALALVAVSQSRATFGGSNGLLVYQAQVGKHIQLFTIRPDGTGARQITRLKDSDALNASWSPDGKRIAFARDYAVGTRREHLDISTVNVDGSGLHGMGLRGLNGDPSWSPDGRII